MIKFYKLKDPHGYMGNFYRARFFVFDQWWNSVEHAYQAQKTDNLDEQNAIRLAIKPSIARDLGQKVLANPNWDFRRVLVMQDCLVAKFLQHKDIRDQLMATGDQQLIEDSPVDYFWGCGADGTGKNMLGLQLMEVRQKLRGE